MYENIGKGSDTTLIYEVKRMEQVDCILALFVDAKVQKLAKEYKKPIVLYSDAKVQKLSRMKIAMVFPATRHIINRATALKQAQKRKVPTEMMEKTITDIIAQRTEETAKIRTMIKELMDVIDTLLENNNTIFFHNNYVRKRSGNEYELDFWEKFVQKRPDKPIMNNIIIEQTQYYQSIKRFI